MIPLKPVNSFTCHSFCLLCSYIDMNSILIIFIFEASIQIFWNQTAFCWNFWFRHFRSGSLARGPAFRPGLAAFVHLQATDLGLHPSASASLRGHDSRAHSAKLLSCCHCDILWPWVMSFIELEIFTCDFETRLPWQFHAMPGDWSKDLWQWSQSVEFLCRHTCDTLVEPTTQGAQCRATPYSWLYDCRAPPRRGMIAWDMYGPLTWAWLTGSATRAFRFELLQHFPGSLWDPGHFNFDIVVLFFVGSAQESILNGTEAWHNPCGKPCIVQLYNPSLHRPIHQITPRWGPHGMCVTDATLWILYIMKPMSRTHLIPAVKLCTDASFGGGEVVSASLGPCRVRIRCEEKSGTKLDFGFCQFPPVFSGCHWGGVGNASSRVGSNALSYFSCEGIGVWHSC